MVEHLLASETDCTEIATAPDVESARRLMKEFEPTVITLDLNMPGLDGLSFLDELRGHSHAPIIVLSSAVGDGSAVTADALGRGAYACFDKGKMLSDAKALIRTLKRASRRSHEAAVVRR
jgi:two-component system chemotaxis response regulator CheB